MRDYYPLLVIGAILGTLSIIFILAFALMRDKKTAIGFDRNMKDGYVLKRLLVYAKPYTKHFILVFVIVMASVAYDIIAPLIIGRIEEIVKVPSFELSALWLGVAEYAVILGVSLACTYFQAVILQKVGQKIVSAIREDVFKHIESLSHAQLNSIPVGTLTTRAVYDTDSISVMFTQIIVNLAKNVVLVIGVLVAMLLLNYELTLMVLCFVPFVVLFTFVFRKFSRRAHRRVKTGTTDLNSFLSENLSGMKVTQLFNRQDRKIEEFMEKNRALKRAKYGQIFTFSIFRPLVYMLYVSSVVCLFYLGGKGYLDGSTFMGQTINGGTIVIFYMYISKFFTPIQQFAEQFNRMQSAFASAEKIFTILEIDPNICDDEDAIELENIKGDIRFNDVWFAYEKQEWVLKGVSFSVKAGQTVAFVGATGSGKTTILSLLCRNYEVAKGSITVDGIDIRKIKISSLRKRFGQMLQDVFLFSGTIKSNLVLEEDFSDDEINEACKLVNADKLIAKLPNGLMEEVRERGNNFSAGERQLISFARTVLHKPDVMILDEATANIDAETEKLIQSSLENMMSVSTMLIVAHRLSTISKADNIIVLSHGEVVEQGNHSELLAKRGRYYYLYTLQLLSERK